MTKEELEELEKTLAAEDLEEEEGLKVFEKIMELHEAELLEQVGPDRKVNWGWGMSENSVASKVYASETKPQVVFCTEHDDQGNLISWDLEER